MNDDEVRALLRTAHVDDNAPPFAATLGRARTRRPTLAAIPAAALAVAAAAVFFVGRAPSVDDGARVDAGTAIAFDAPELRVTTLREPTDALLSLPGATFLSSTPTLRIPEGATP